MSKIISATEIINWCDKQVAEGKEITLCWEGGGDSGWVYFKIDGVQAEGEEIEALVDMMYNELDYGSWAGEFSANGTADYDPTTKCFEGVDYYSEDDWTDTTFEEPFAFYIPSTYGFDSIEYNIEGSFEDDFRVEITFNIVNGFITPELRELEDEISKAVKEKIISELSEFKEIDVNYFGTHELAERHEMKIEKENVIFEIPTIHYSVYNTEEKGVTIDLKERLENETDDE
jgi:hypothetical protein